MGYDVFDPHNDIEAGEMVRDRIISELKGRVVIVLVSANFFCLSTGNMVDRLLEEIWPTGKKKLGYVISPCLSGYFGGAEMRIATVASIEEIVTDLNLTLV